MRGRIWGTGKNMSLHLASMAPLVHAPFSPAIDWGFAWLCRDPGPGRMGIIVEIPFCGLLLTSIRSCMHSGVGE